LFLIFFLFLSHIFSFRRKNNSFFALLTGNFQRYFPGVDASVDGPGLLLFSESHSFHHAAIILIVKSSQEIGLVPSVVFSLYLI
jgi:hypothetical protein